MLRPIAAKPLAAATQSLKSLLNNAFTKNYVKLENTMFSKIKLLLKALLYKIFSHYMAAHDSSASITPISNINVKVNTWAANLDRDGDGIASAR